MSHSHSPSSKPQGPKVAGVLIPLFSIRTARSLGVGDVGDLPSFARWVAESGHKLIQILPIGELPGGETSPYAAATSFGIDPVYVAVDKLEDVRDEDRYALVGPDADKTLARLASSPTVEWNTVREIKRRVLRAAFDAFYSREWGTGSQRDAGLRKFMEEEGAWLADWSLFRAFKQRYGETWWRAWPDAVRDHEPRVLSAYGRELEHAALEQVYIQWVAHQQWAEARREVNALGVELMGDLPFMVGCDSSDVWGRRTDFHIDATLGVPGDPWIPEGQDWGLPSYDWPAMDKSGLDWVRRRALDMGRLYDRFRLDHLVGYYRMYVRPKDGGAPRWVPAEEPDQIVRGEKVLSAIVESAGKVGAKVIAEDLGTIPPFVRKSMHKLSLPGYRVIMWEKDGDVFRDPASYPYVSLATTGTHDTITLATWWKDLSFHERRHALHDLPSLRAVASDHDVDTLSARVHAGLLEAVYSSGSELALLPIQDLLGTTDRINVPGIAAPTNWAWRLSETVDQLRADEKVAQKMRTARELLTRHGR